MEKPLSDSMLLEANEQTNATKESNQSTSDEGPVEQVEQLCLFDRLPTELFCIIMDILEVGEQFTVRRVCHSWKATIEWMLSGVPKDCMKINVKKSRMIGQEGYESRCVRTWQPNESVRRMQFEFAYTEPVVAPSQLIQISIYDRAFNSEAAEAIGRIFPKVRALIIYWDTDDSEQTIDNLVMLLSQFTEFKVMTTFGLIVSGKVHNSSTLSKICASINTHLAPLKQLHLMMPWCIQRTIQQHGEDLVSAHPPVELNNAIASSTDFNMTGIVNNGSNLLENVCQMPIDQNANGIKCSQLEGIGFTLYLENEDWPNQFFASLDLNKDKFVSVKRLLLVNILQLDAVQRVLKYFPNVEQLFMQWSGRFKQTFGHDWISALKPLTKLTELTLLDFNFERKRLQWGNQHAQIDETVNLEQLRKLTFACPDLIFDIRKASNPFFHRCPFIPQLKPEDIGHTISMRFPGLHEINLWSGDCELHQSDQITWQTVEQNVNRDLPLSLPQLPGLRVDIQLRHPLLYANYRSLSAEANVNFQRAIATSEACRLNVDFVATNEIIERRLERAEIVHARVDIPLFARAFMEMRRAERQHQG